MPLHRSTFRAHHQEDISGTYVPLTSTNLYTPRHNPLGDFSSWSAISTNQVSTNTFAVLDGAATNFNVRFYRLVQLP